MGHSAPHRLGGHGASPQLGGGFFGKAAIGGYLPIGNIQQQPPNQPAEGPAFRGQGQLQGGGLLPCKIPLQPLLCLGEKGEILPAGGVRHTAAKVLLTLQPQAGEPLPVAGQGQIPQGGAVFAPVPHRHCLLFLFTWQPQRPPGFFYFCRQKCSCQRARSCWNRLVSASQSSQRR